MVGIGGRGLAPNWGFPGIRGHASRVWKSRRDSVRAVGAAKTGWWELGKEVVYEYPLGLDSAHVRSRPRQESLCLGVARRTDSLGAHLSPTVHHGDEGSSPALTMRRDMSHSEAEPRPIRQRHEPPPAQTSQLASR